MPVVSTTEPKNSMSKLTKTIPYEQRRLLYFKKEFYFIIS